MNRLLAMSIRTQILLLAFIVAIPAAGIITYSGIHMRQEAIYDARMETLRLADNIAAEQQNLITAAQQAIIALAQLPDVKKQNAARVQPILRDILKLNTQFSNIFMADRNGLVWGTAVPLLLHQNISDRRYFKNALASGQLSSGEYVISRATTRPAFNVAAPLKNERGATIGVISVGFVLDAYKQVLERAKLPPGTSFVLLDHKGVVLYRAISPAGYTGRQYDAALFKDMQQGPDVATFDSMTTISGDRRVLTYRKMRLPGEQSPYMYIRTGIPIAAVLAKANKALTRNLVVFISFLVLAIFFSWLIGKRSIADRIILLENASRKLAEGDLHVRVSELVAGGELGRLGQTFDAMARHLSQREQALRASEDRLWAAVNVSQIGIFDHDQCIDAIYWSPQQRLIHGWGPDEPVTLQEFINLVHPEDLEGIGKSIRRAHDPAGDGIWDVELRIIRRDGTIRWLKERSQTFFEGEGDARRPVRTIGAVLDITERKHAEEEKQKLVSVIEMSRDFISIADLDGRILYVNEAGLSLVGLDSIEESRTKSVQDFLMETDHRRLETEMLPTIFGTGTWIGELALRHFKTGTPIPVEMNAFTIKDTKSDKPIALANISRDITERKHAEEEKQKLQSQLVQAQKMESIGQLAGGVAHDFNNILTAIIGYGSILQKKIAANDPLRINVDQVLEAAGRAAQLTRSLLAFSRKQVLNTQPTPLNGIIAGQEQFLRRIIGEDIEMRTILRSDAVIMADSGQIEQVLMNLATNARDAMPKGGQLTVETDLLEITEAFISAHGFGTPGTYAMISVTDTGIGINEEAKQKIFEPFFTTKEVGRGTGLGMAIVYGIVKQHKGYINVYSQVGKGTTFKIYFPVYSGQAAQRKKSIYASPVMTGTETILLAEDDATLRTFFRDILTERGYTVVVAENGEDAIRKFSERKDEIKLIVVDMIMPKKSGREVFEAAQTMKPGTKVIFSSGYTADKVQQEGLPVGSEFIAKPASPQEYLKKIREVLDGYSTK